jgi:hypothetical protein
MQRIQHITSSNAFKHNMMRPRTTRTTTTKRVMSSQLNIIQNMLKKEPSIHFVNGVNVSDDVLNTKVIYVFKNPHQNDKLVHIKQGALGAVSSSTLDSLKTHLDLNFQVYAITQKDFKLYLQDNRIDGVVIYNAYSDIRKKATYILYFDM